MKEATTIYLHLKDGNEYLANCLMQKTEDYKKYLAEAILKILSAYK